MWGLTGFYEGAGLDLRLRVSIVCVFYEDTTRVLVWRFAAKGFYSVGSEGSHEGSIVG